MVNFVLSSLPTYYMSALKLPKKVTQHINCARGGGGGAWSHQSVIAWDLVCKPNKGWGAWSYQFVIPKHSLLLKHLSFF